VKNEWGLKIKKMLNPSLLQEELLTKLKKFPTIPQNQTIILIWIHINLDNQNNLKSKLFQIGKKWEIRLFKLKLHVFIHQENSYKLERKFQFIKTDLLNSTQPQETVTDITVTKEEEL